MPQRRPISRRTCAAFVAACIIIIFHCGLAFGEDADSGALRRALSSRHQNAPAAELEKLSGGRDRFVTSLLELRREEQPPWLALRAEKLLLGYADREEVFIALERDLEDPKLRGLAQIITLHIDRVRPDAARLSLVRSALARAKTDAAFRPIAESLRENRDPRIRRLAETELAR